MVLLPDNHITDAYRQKLKELSEWRATNSVRTALETTPLSKQAQAMEEFMSLEFRVDLAHLVGNNSISLNSQFLHTDTLKEIAENEGALQPMMLDWGVCAMLRDLTRDDNAALHTFAQITLSTLSDMLRDTNKGAFFSDEKSMANALKNFVRSMTTEQQEEFCKRLQQDVELNVAANIEYTPDYAITAYDVVLSSNGPRAYMVLGPSGENMQLSNIPSVGLQATERAFRDKYKASEAKDNANLLPRMDCEDSAVRLIAIFNTMRDHKPENVSPVWDSLGLKSVKPVLMAAHKMLLELGDRNYCATLGTAQQAQAGRSNVNGQFGNELHDSVQSIRNSFTKTQVTGHSWVCSLKFEQDLEKPNMYRVLSKKHFEGTSPTATLAASECVGCDPSGLTHVDVTVADVERSNSISNKLHDLPFAQALGLISSEYTRGVKDLMQKANILANVKSVSSYADDQSPGGFYTTLIAVDDKIAFTRDLKSGEITPGVSAWRNYEDSQNLEQICVQSDMTPEEKECIEVLANCALRARAPVELCKIQILDYQSFGSRPTPDTTQPHTNHRLLCGNSFTVVSTHTPRDLQIILHKLLQPTLNLNLNDVYVQPISKDRLWTCVVTCPQ